MLIYKKTYFLLFLVGCLGLSNASSAQKIVINEADSSWMGKEIPSKTLSKKKFTFNRRWYQNLVTHFNYYYNAHQTLKKAIEQATEVHRDRYDSLLTFYPYTPDDFETVKSSLDSVILNAGIGIEVHDPRGKWIDNLYLLVGKASYYKQDYGEAIASFKYIIKNKGAKDEEDQPAIIGSRAYHSEENISIVTPEKKKRMSHPPSRNDAFIWLVRSYLASGQEDQATALLNALEEDPQLPERLQAPLTAIKARQSLQKEKPAVTFNLLKKAITLQPDKPLKARWQFILAQLYEKDRQWDEAFKGYQQVRRYSPPPLMAFYAQLNQVQIQVLRNLENFQRSSRPLLTMAKKEKYARYRSIIYYHLGKLALQAGYMQEGIAYLKKSLDYNPDQDLPHLRAYAMLADLYYDHRQYRPARAYYDSAAALQSAPNPILSLRKEALTDVVKNLDVIDREDSLKTLALLPRDSLLQYLDGIVQDSLKAQRKRNRILKGPGSNKNGIFGRNTKDEAENTLARNNTSNGSWYFYNNNAKARGFSEFKAAWGNRQNQDNWRLSHPNLATAPSTGKENVVLATDSQPALGSDKADQLLQKLLDPLPLSPEKLKISDSLSMKARHQIVNIFFLRLHDDKATLPAIDSLLLKHPQNPYLADLYYKLYLIYSRTHDLSKAAYYKQLLDTRFADSKYAAALNEKPVDTSRKILSNAIMHLYDSAYISYLTGSYGTVARLRDSASYLDPGNKEKGRFSLLNAMTILKTRSDSAGIAALQQVIQKNATDTPIVAQARRILDALQHKEELVEHLMDLQLTEEQEAPAKNPPSEGQPAKEEPKPSALNTIASNRHIQTADKQPGQKEAGQVTASHTPQMDSLHRARLRAEALRQMALEKEQQEATDSTATVDSTHGITPATPVTPYEIEREIPYFVVLSFNRINGDLIKHTLKEFSDYNRKFHASDSIEVSSFVLSHNQVILIFRLFKNETEALLYYKEMQEKAPISIIPDVRSSYYKFFFISKSNFILLNNTQDYKGYLNFFHKHYK